MIRNIDMVAFQKPPTKKGPGKPHLLRPKDISKAFSRPDAILGQTASGVYVFLANLNKGHNDITIILMAAEGDPLKIKTTVESIFISNEVVPEAEPVPGEIDLRRFADGVFSGSWHVYEEKGFSFCFLVGAGYRVQLTDGDALLTLTKILETFKGGRK